MCTLHGRDLRPGRADADLRLGEVLAREADRVQHGAARARVRAVDDQGGNAGACVILAIA